eukprot:CAMPEP_0170748214 /NCGR_PEP_ID=MMETSP0437-20130122/9732_1 /TAXON_ID=0 /ORGANISM="Sexangularia sp." /LENGTH=149 /DNA_ID=CAMNT_0011087035 /DNA_START=35 /DNA_END=480 /DNA_ORIENTATION=-
MSEAEKALYNQLVDELPEMSYKAFVDFLPLAGSTTVNDIEDCETLYQQLESHVRQVKADAKKAISEHVDRQKRKYGEVDGPAVSLDDQPIVDGMSAKELIAKMKERTDELAQANEDAVEQIAKLEREVEQRLKALSKANKRVGVVREDG